jgi:hypothetical protein
MYFSIPWPFGSSRTGGRGRRYAGRRENVPLHIHPRSKSILDGSRSLDQILKIGLAAGVRLRRLREGTKSSTASPRSRVGRALAEVAHSAE